MQTSFLWSKVKTKREACPLFALERGTGPKGGNVSSPLFLLTGLLYSVPLGLALHDLRNGHVKLVMMITPGPHWEETLPTSPHPLREEISLRSQYWEYHWVFGTCDLLSMCGGVDPGIRHFPVFPVLHKVEASAERSVTPSYHSSLETD